MDTERMLKPALIGGVLLGVLSSLPILNLFNCICCAWVIGGGLLAAYLYVKESPSPVSLGGGVAIGLFAGIIGAVVSALFSIPLNYLLHSGGMDIAEQIRIALDQVPNLPPETRETIEAFSNRGNMGLLYFLSALFFTLVTFCLFAMLGGAIGVAVFEKRKPGTAPADHNSYSPPGNVPPPPPPNPE